MIMSEAMQNISANAVLFGSLVLVTQGIVGFPIASLLCRKEAARLKTAFRAGEISLPPPAATATEQTHRRLISPVPEKYHEANFIIAKLSLVACLASWLSGLPCCAIVSILVGKIFHESWYLCCAMNITALFGFPGTVIVPTEVTKAVAETENEKKLIQGSIMPKMIISGMVSVSVVSVVVAGIMSAWA